MTRSFNTTDGRFAIMFEAGCIRVNAPESPFRDLGFDSEANAEAWLAEHGYTEITED